MANTRQSGCRASRSEIPLFGRLGQRRDQGCDLGAPVTLDDLGSQLFGVFDAVVQKSCAKNDRVARIDGVDENECYPTRMLEVAQWLAVRT